MRMSEFTNSMLLMGRLRQKLHELSSSDRRAAEELIKETAARLKKSPHYWYNVSRFFHPMIADEPI